MRWRCWIFGIIVAIVGFGIGFGPQEVWYRVNNHWRGTEERVSMLREVQTQSTDDLAATFVAVERAGQLLKAGYLDDSKSLLIGMVGNGWVEPDVLYLLGEIAWREKQAQQASDYWQRLLRQFPLTPAAVKASKSLERRKKSSQN